MFLRYTFDDDAPFDLIGLHKESNGCHDTLDDLFSQVADDSIEYFDVEDPNIPQLEGFYVLVVPLEFFVCS